MDNTRKNQFLKIMHRIITQLKDKLTSLERQNIKKDESIPSMLSKLKTIKQSYNPSEDIFVYPDKDMRTILLPKKTLLCMKVVGNYIWEFKVKSYTNEVLYEGTLTEDNDYTSDTIADLIYSIFYENINFKSDPEKHSIEQEIQIREEIATALTFEVINTHQGNKLQEEINYLTEIIHPTHSNILKDESR